MRHQVRGEGRHLLLLPSFTLGSDAMIQAFEPILSDVAGWSRIYVDLPGTGMTPPCEPTSDSVLEALIEVVQETVGPRKFAVAGWSYGGYLAAGLTRRIPDAVAGVLLVCTGLRIRPQDRDLAGTLESTEEEGWLNSVPDALHSHFRHAVGRQTRDVGDRIARTLEANGPTDTVYLETLRRDGMQLSDEAGGLIPRGAISLMAGRRDRVAGYRNLYGLLPGLEQADFVLLNSAGHYLPLEEPRLFGAAALAWLDACDRFVSSS